jgi:hypothetical protein
MKFDFFVLFLFPSDELREHLKSQPKVPVIPKLLVNLGSDSSDDSSDSDSDSDDSSDTSSDSSSGLYTS